MFLKNYFILPWSTYFVIAPFATAFAADIENGFAEIGKRKFYINFGEAAKHIKLSKGYIIYVDIHYICRSSFYEEDSERDENLFIAEYAKCGEWYHKICLKTSLRVL